MGIFWVIGGLNLILFLKMLQYCWYKLYMIFRLLFKLNMSLSFVTNILAQNRLIGPNFIVWKCNLEYILIAKEHDYVILLHTLLTLTDAKLEKDKA